MEREVSQLVRTGVSYKERLFIGNVHLVCPHHKLLDLIGSWDAPNRSTLQALACAAMHVASMALEEYAAEPNDYVRIADGALSLDIVCRRQQREP